MIVRLRVLLKALTITPRPFFPTASATLIETSPEPACLTPTPASPPDASAALMVTDCAAEPPETRIPVPDFPVTGPVAEMASVPESSFETSMPFSAPVTLAVVMAMSCGKPYSCRVGSRAAISIPSRVRPVTEPLVAMDRRPWAL